MTDQPPKQSDSLRKPIKKYQTQQTQRLEEAKRTSQSVPVMPPPAVVKPQKLPSLVAKSETTSLDKLATRTVEVVMARAGWTSQQWAIVAGAALLIILVCSGGGLLALGQITQPTPTPTFVALPIVSATEVLKHLRQVGVAVTNLQTVTVPNQTWAAKQAVQFDARQGSDSGTFLVLSYESVSQTGIDAFKAGSDPHFKLWRLAQINNILLLSAPSTSSVLNQAIGSHLTEYLVAPYRDFLPTATPTSGAR